MTYAFSGYTRFFTATPTLLSGSVTHLNRDPGGIDICLHRAPSFL